MGLTRPGVAVEVRQGDALDFPLIVPDLATKAANLARNIAEDRVRLLQTVAG